MDTKKINSYIKDNKDFNKLKKDLDSQKKEIKSFLTENGISELEGTEYKVVLTESISQSLNLEKALEICKENKINWLIKTKEVIDEEELTSALYKGELDLQLFTPCFEETVNEKLVVRKI